MTNVREGNSRCTRRHRRTQLHPPDEGGRALFNTVIIIAVVVCCDDLQRNDDGVGFWNDFPRHGRRGTYLYLPRKWYRSVRQNRVKNVAVTNVTLRRYRKIAFIKQYGFHQKYLKHKKINYGGRGSKCGFARDKISTIHWLPQRLHQLCRSHLMKSIFSWKDDHFIKWKHVC